MIRSNAEVQRRVPITAVVPLRLRVAFFLFVFTIPIEAMSHGGGDQPTLARFTGYALLGVLLTCPRIAGRRPPAPVLLFAGYLLVTLLLGFVHSGPIDTFPLVLLYLEQRIQLVVMFLIAVLVLRDESIVDGTLLAYCAGSIVLAAFIIGDATGGVARGRSSAFGEDPNHMGSLLALGCIALFGLRGRLLHRPALAPLLWSGIGIGGYALLLTGSRGAIVTLLAGALALVASSLTGKRRLRTAAAVLVVGVFLIALVPYTPLAERWAATMAARDLTFRDGIYMAAVEMFLERPVLGWGPITHLYELGSRAITEAMGLESSIVGTHNVFLWVLTSTGLAGGIPFLSGVFICVRNAVRSRHRVLGSLSLALVTASLTYGLSVDADRHKAYWLFLAMAYAAGAAAFKITAALDRPVPDPNGVSASLLPSPPRALSSSTRRHVPGTQQ